MKKNIDKDGYLILNSCVNAIKIHPAAEIPFKDDYTQVTWDLNIIGRDENRVDDIYGDVNVFTTGIKVKPPLNYHFELLEHPQLYKTGYSLAGGVRIIEDSEEITVPLFKFKESEDLELPFRAVRLILRQSEYVHISDLSSNPQKPTKTLHKEEEAPVKKGNRGRKGNHFF